MRAFRTFIFASVLLGTSGAALAEERTLRDVDGYEAITSSNEARGDDDGFLRELAAAIERDPGGVGGAVALARLDDAQARASDPQGALRPVLERVAAAKPASGPAARENRDAILKMLAALEEYAGDFERAHETAAKRGLVRHWLALGPFGFTDRAVHDRIFPVENAVRARELDVNAAFEGTWRSASWRRAEADPFDGTVEPFQYLRPRQGAAYALAQVSVKVRCEAVLALRSRGSYRAWLNGRLVAAIDRTQQLLPLELAVVVTLDPGWNRLLVKVEAGHAAFEARITDVAGVPIDGLLEAEGERIEPLEAGSEGPPPLADAPTATAELLRRLAELEAGAATDRGARALVEASLGILYLERGLGADALVHLEAAAELAPTAPHIHVLRAQAIEAAAHLPDTNARTQSRAAYQRAFELEPAFLPVLERRALYLSEDGKPDEAVKALREILKAHPERAQAHYHAAEIARQQGWDTEALEHARRVIELRPKSPYPRVFLAELYAEKGNRSRALEIYREALALAPSIVWIEERIAGRLLAQGDAAGAERIRRALAERYPHEPQRLAALAEALRARRAHGEAAELLLRAAALVPEEAAYPRMAGEALLDGGRREDGLALLERSLALAPGQHALRRMLLEQRGEPWDFSRDYDVDVAAMLPSAPGEDEHPRASSICLLDQTVARLYRDGTSSQIVHQAFKILDEGGVDRYHTINIPGEILELRTFRPSGEVLEPIITDATSEILMPGLEPGAVIEYRYRLDDSSPPDFQINTGTWFFQDPNLTEPFLLSRYVVIADEDLEFETIERNLGDRIRKRSESKGGTVVHVWESPSADRIEPEDLMPAKEEILPWVTLIGRRSWDEISELYRDRALGRTELTPPIVAKARELTKGLEGDTAKARVLYDFVLDHVRNDSGGSNATAVLIERGGSRELLLKALLDAAGVPNRYAFCGTNPDQSQEVLWDPPRPELLATAVLRIEPRDAPPVWILSGGRLLPYGEIPAYLAGAPALLVGPGGGEWTVVPRGSPESRAIASHLTIALSGRNAACEGRTIMPDFFVYGVKERIATLPRAQLRNLIEQQVNELFPGARLKDFDFPGVDHPGVPLEITFRCEVPELVALEDGKPVLKSGLEELGLTRTYGGKPVREYPILFRMEQVQRETVEIDLGESYEVEALPPNMIVRSGFISYSLTFALEGSRLTVVRTCHLEPSRIEAHDYPRLLQTLRDIDAAESKRIHLRERR